MARKRKEITESNEETGQNSRRSARLVHKKKSSYFEAADNSEEEKETPPKKVKISEPRKNSSKKKNVKKANNKKNVSKYFGEESTEKENEVVASTSTDTGFGEETDSDEDEWEEVKPLEQISTDDLANCDPELPADAIQITVNVQGSKTKQKKKWSVEDAIRQQINKKIKEKQENMHKTHLLCCVASGLHMNSTLNDNSTIKALSLSFLTDNVFQIKNLTIKSLKSILKWFRDHFRYKDNKSTKQEAHFSDMLSNAFSLQETSFESVFAYILVCLLRSIETVSIEVRLCYAINPVPLRPKNLILSDKQRERKNMTKRGKEEVGKKEKKVKDTILISSDDEDVIVESFSQSSGAKQRLRQFWLEVYFPTDKRWVYVDPVSGIVDDVTSVEKHTYSPLLYVFAFDNKNYINDVTKKYNQKWIEREFRVNRVNEQWLQETLNAFKSPLVERSDEDLQMKQIVSKQPIPSTLAAFKNHPLYVLEKHLLKYEVIYPKDTPRITSFRGSNVYSREYVQTVHSDIYWRRQGRVIRSGEVAYKVSKARPKWSKISQSMVHGLPLELFGYWQTEPFVPPVAKDGKVPRNEFGNVELFQADMLPKGTVHLPIPGLLRIANKLGIDCVPAVVGFDVHARGGGTHPVYDGFVVCEEFKEVLLAAYDEEEENSRKRLQEKKTIRALKNWRRLVKSMLIRDKVRKKYSSDV